LLHDGLAEESQRSSTGELSGLDEHLADVASETFEREFELGLLATIEAEIAELGHAVERAVAGTYGVCDVCGVPIPDARLRAVPGATRCLPHQEAVELAEQTARGGGCEHSAAMEAAAHLDLLATDDEPRPTVAAEDAAMHILDPTADRGFAPGSARTFGPANGVAGARRSPRGPT
jgi:RNA polymerase-binding transcription factor DksA